jgi:hypothetical protein
LTLSCLPNCWPPSNPRGANLSPKKKGRPKTTHTHTHTLTHCAKCRGNGQQRTFPDWAKKKLARSPSSELRTFHVLCHRLLGYAAHALVWTHREQEKKMWRSQAVRQGLGTNLNGLWRSPVDLLGTKVSRLGFSVVYKKRGMGWKCLCPVVDNHTLDSARSSQCNET